MDRIARTLNRITSQLSTEYLVTAAVCVLIWIICFRVSRKLSGRYRFLLRMLLGLVAVRFVLLGNPFAWYGYGMSLTPDDVGYRQCDIISRYPRRVFYRKPQSLRYLIVGSSQIPAVFFKYCQTRADHEIYWLSAFRPLGFEMYKRDIVAHEPRFVLLYLSELDIARMPRLDAAAIGPSQGVSFPSFAWTLKSRMPGSETLDVIRALAIGELFPEAKYAWIFKGLLQKFLHVNSREKLPKPHSINPDDVLTSEGIDVNMAYLRDFVAFLEARNINTIVVEGQYNPQAYSPHCRELNSKVSRQLSSLADQSEFVRFIERDQCPQFRSDDYLDFVHVDQMKGLEFSSQLFETLDAITE